jgi:Nif-specific regulatory protein
LLKPPSTELTRDQYQTLLTISRLLNATEYTESLIEQALDLLIEALAAERGVFVRYESQGQKFEMVAGRNVEGDSIANLSQFSAGLLQQVADSRAPMLYHDVQSDPHVSQFTSVRIQGIRSVMAVPIFNRSELWGVILLDSRQQRAGFREENLGFMEFFASLVSLTLDRITALEQLRDENRILQAGRPSLPELVGESEPMKELAGLVRKVAPTDAGVLLQGESGTGKELVARAIHNLSLRRDKTFLAQFCGSIPDTLLESELFGHKRGAFTGAVSDKKGLFEIAGNGTFFLDEIADISLALQAKLLRVLQDQEITRLGETQPRKVNVRIIAATHQDLLQLCKEKKFRHDLYYRLYVFPIRLPALRERMSDVPLLAQHFLTRYGSAGLRLSAKAMARLHGYSWPGNVRQLENVVRRAIILCEGAQIEAEHIILEEEPGCADGQGTLKEHEMQLLQNRLQRFDGNRTKTARSLGVSSRWVQLKLREMQTR